MPKAKSLKEEAKVILQGSFGTTSCGCCSYAAVVVMGMIDPVFFKVRTIMNIFVQGSILGILALAVGFTLLIAEIDLSIVGIAALSACIGTMWMKTRAMRPRVFLGYWPSLSLFYLVLLWVSSTGCWLRG